MSATPTTELTEPFTERVNRLFRELERAVKWDRPAILLAIYSSEFVRADAQTALATKLQEIGQRAIGYQVKDAESADILVYLSQHPDLKDSVFFVSGLHWGEGPDGRNAYRALNIRREYFVEHRIRAVLWLTESEAIGLPKYAPDFWAFRHRVVEFVESARIEQIEKTASTLTWQDFGNHTLHENTDAKIELREALLRDLPPGEETLLSRAELLYTLAGLYQVKQDYERSLSYFQESIEITDQIDNKQLLSWCYNGMGTTYAEWKHSDKAIDAYRQAIELNPTSALPYYGLGNLYHELGRTDEAIAAYQRAIELDPKDAAPYNNLGNVYRDLKRTDDAIAAYQRAIEFDPEEAGLYNNLGSAYRDLGRIDEAITAYQRAIELNPRDAGLYTNLCNIYRVLERIDEALAANQRAIELEPNSASAHNNLGNIYADLGHNDEAIAAYQHAIDADPKDAYYSYYNLGNIYARQSRCKDGITAYKQAIKLEPHRVLARASLAGCYSKLNRKSSYADEIATTRPLLGTANEYERALFAVVRRDVDEALTLLELALKKNQVARLWVRRDPDFAAIKDDPRFKALVGDPS